MNSSALRLHRPTVTAIAALVVSVVACAKGGDKTATGDTSTTSTMSGMQMSTQTASPTPAAPTGAGRPSVDPKNLSASITWDAATKTLTMPLVTALTSDAGGWNFNGYARGQMRITVPLGAKVVFHYYNEDIIPHSALIVAGSATNIPSAPTTPIFPGATSRNPDTGIAPNTSDDLQFTADKVGQYLLVCGVPGHAVSGMWDWFEVSSSATTPSVKTT